jgi:hypothetical protein
VGVQTIHLVELANNRTTARRPHPGIRHDDQAWHVPTEAYLAPNADSVGRGVAQPVDVIILDAPSRRGNKLV